MSVQLLTLLIIKLMGWHTPAQVSNAERYAYYITYYSRVVEMDPKIPTAVIFRESSFNERKIGKSGEIGLGQIKRHTRASRGYDKLGRKGLMDANLNIYLTIKHLDFSRTTCDSDNPNAWLSLYNGWKKKNGHCYKTKYSKNVMHVYRVLKKLEIENVVD